MFEDMVQTEVYEAVARVVCDEAKIHVRAYSIGVIRDS